MMMNCKAWRTTLGAIAIAMALTACGGDPEPEDPQPKPGPGRVEATLDPYVVKGEDCDEVRAALFPEANSHPGKTDCQPLVPRFGFSASADDEGNCRLTLGNVDTTYTIVIRLPKWDAPADADRRCFDEFLKKLRTHEDAHADACREHVPKLLEAAKAALDGLNVSLTGPCKVEGGQVMLSEAQEKQLDDAVNAALAGSDAYKSASGALNKAQDAVDADDSLDAVLNCECS